MNQTEKTPSQKQTERKYLTTILGFKPTFGDQDDIRVMKLMQKIANSTMTNSDKEIHQTIVINIIEKK